MLVKLLDWFKDQTSWAFIILAGGPDYSKDGKIKIFSIHVRETPLEMDFMWAHNAFGKKIMKPFDTYIRHVHANSTATSQGPSNMGKSPDPTVSQPLQPSIESANMLTAAHPTNGYFSETNISMNSNGPECKEDVISVTSSDVSMFFQWSFDAEDSHLTSPDPPHGMYLPPVSSSSIPFAPTPMLMSSLSLGFSFLDELNNPFDFGIPATDSDSGSLQ
ncbi:hypothetical protein HD554DRAFT_2177136 [Boletus coccyginus]|nr:hypothetical protein HD554DRAFT_2177136 [Boletus coccyginus]